MTTAGEKPVYKKPIYDKARALGVAKGAGLTFNAFGFIFV